MPTARTLKALWSCFERSDARRAAQVLCALARRGEQDPLGLFAGHPLEDDWRDFAGAAVAEHLRQRRGLVYVVANPSQHGFFKIGVTAFDVNKRLRSLVSAGVVGEFIAIDTAIAHDRFASEGGAHKSMERVAQRHKEFFYTDYQTASRVMQDSVRHDNELLQKAFPGVEPLL